LGNLSLNIEIKTVMALDNASIHKVHKVYKILNLQAYWQKEDCLFFSPPYSPPLNIAEGLWKKIEED
jgi:transposase